MRIQDMMKTKAADAEKHAAQMSEAVEKAKAETSSAGNATPAGNQDEIAKQHAEELKALEEKLKKEYETELKTRIDTAIKEALAAQPAPTLAPTNPDQQAAIDAAIEEFKKTIEEKHTAEIASAVDRGRMEQAAKGKLKDSQLVKAQKRVKDLEAQIHEWQAAGIVLPPPSTPAVTPAAPSATTPTAPKPSAVAAATSAPVVAPANSAGTSQPKPAPAVAANANANTNAANLPRRPPPGNAGPPAGPARGGAARVLGRGGVPLGVARGGVPLRTAPVRPPQAAQAPPLSGGVSIMGAAKRPREDGSVASDDSSLAKRLKPAEAPNRPPPVRPPPGGPK